MKDKKNRVDITRQERKRQLLKFIENKRAKSLYPPVQKKSPLKENKNIKVPSSNREEKPRELENTYINGSNRRKKRREKVAENYARKEELKKQRLVAAQQEKQRKLEVKEKEKEEKSAEKKAVIARIKEEKRQKKLEALRLRQETELKREQEKKERAERAAKEVEAAKKAKETALQQKIHVERVDNLSLENKIKLLEFIKTRKILNEQAAERKRILKTVAEEKRTVEKIAKEKVVPVAIPVPVVSPEVRVAKKAIPATDRTEKKRISGHIALLVKEASRLNALAVQVAVGRSVNSVQKFVSNFKKKPVSPPKKGPVSRAKNVSRYREPFLILPFIRRNAFKFVFLLLVLVWFIENFLLIRRFQEPQERLKAIVGGELSSEREPSTEEVTESETLVLSKPERIDINGKRDPFSPGLLTMKVLDKPSPTNIVLAPRPEVISILRPAKIVSVIRGEEKLEPKKVGEVTNLQTPAYSSILKSSPARELSKPSALSPLKKIQAPEPSPLLIPEKRCDLICRGRMVIEGVEYLFIEGKQRTYRVTVGDVVEGFRILKKEKNKLYLSKDGILYEITID